MAHPTLTFTCNLPTSREARNIATTIKFGTGFGDLEVILGKAPFVVVKVATPEMREPAAEFNLKSFDDFPVHKKTKTSVTDTITPTKTVVPTTKGKEIMIIEDPTEGLTVVPSTFEIGSSSKTIPLTRSQKRNGNRKARKAAKKQISEKIPTEEGPYQKEEELSEIYPMLRRGKFYPLMNTEGHENIPKIAATLPTSQEQ
ncbi:uncharacterized protein LOC110036269, partial [Phalaenopsis equestris]|uniref:uncharacterized protein LOC110036269 n=1 Tax=Phalaenopsis equestris TaxID=78828 RepID=UPI0009E480BF